MHIYLLSQYSTVVLQWCYTVYML